MKLTHYGGYFDPDTKSKRIKELEEIMNEPNFWNDKKTSEKVINELNTLKNQMNKVEELKEKVITNKEMLNDLKEDFDEDIALLLSEDSKTIEESLKEVKIELTLNGEFDKNDAVVEIHSGAGGTEACDWALMLNRMYQRYFEKKNYKFEVVDEQPGEETGIKSIYMLVHGINAYGYLKSEKGVHRLVRISPFDSNARRHTSFASVDITPLFENTEVDIEIKESDLKIDVYRSSGAGGQSVNTTDSAVRITHLPTKTVITCQNERSQIQNKEKALELLKNKLYQMELEKRSEELKSIKGEQMDINFGSQIRSYVMHPYSMVKDHRTNTETSAVNKVLDGDIDIFINDYLMKGC